MSYLKGVRKPLPAAPAPATGQPATKSAKNTAAVFTAPPTPPGRPDQPVQHAPSAVKQAISRVRRAVCAPITSQSGKRRNPAGAVDPKAQHHAGIQEARRALNDLISQHPELARGILRHPRLKDGVTASNAPIIASLPPAAKNNPGMIQDLLELPPEAVREKTIRLPGRPLRLAAITPENGQGTLLDELERAVREAQEFMQSPLPATAVFLLETEAVAPGAAAVNHICCIAISPERTGRKSGCAARLRHVLTHETLHYWWMNNAPWLDEGLCDIIPEAMPGRKNESRLQPVTYQAWPATTPERLDKSQGRNYGDCYAEGQRFFLDLLSNTGAVYFKEAVNRLHRKAAAAGKPLGIRQVLEAFPDYRSEAERAYQNGGQPAQDALRKPPREAKAAVPQLRVWKEHLAEGNPGRTMERLPKAGEKPQTAVRLRFLSLAGEEQHRHTAFTIINYGPDGLPYQRFPVTADAPANSVMEWAVSVGPEIGRPWAPGAHRTEILNEGGNRIAEIAFTIRG